MNNLCNRNKSTFLNDINLKPKNKPIIALTREAEFWTTL